MSYQIAYFMWKTPLQSGLDNIRDLLEHLENMTLIHIWCFHRSTNWTWEWRLLTYLRIWDPSWSKPIVTPIIWLPMANWLLLITQRLLAALTTWPYSTPHTSSSHVGPDRSCHSALHPLLGHVSVMWFETTSLLMCVKTNKMSYALLITLMPAPVAMTTYTSLTQPTPTLCAISTKMPCSTTPVTSFISLSISAGSEMPSGKRKSMM